MFSDSAEETLTLTMGELQLQLPRTTTTALLSQRASLSPSPPPPLPLYTLENSSASTELLDIPDVGIDFYSSPFDNPFPLQGFLSNNERGILCSSPNNSNADMSFLSDASFSTNALSNSIWSPSSSFQVSAVSNESSNNGNISICSSGGDTPCRGNGSSLNWDENLVKGLTKQQLLQFVELLKEKLEEGIQSGDESYANQVRGAMVNVQNYIINTFVSESSESVCSVSTPTTTIPSPLLSSPLEGSFDSKYQHRDNCGKDAPYTWSGHLPPRIHKNPTYSCKVFLGGLPWDITEVTLMGAFKQYGISRIEWPGKEGVSTKPKGYAYAVFETEKQVKLLLQNCTQDYNHSRTGNYYYKVSSKKFRGKDVQIIPWALSDSNYSRYQTYKIDPQRTIFVGALHGMVNAEGLATIMNDLFGGVVYAGIDTDRSKYPIGSARVTFSNTHSYMKAVSAAFVIIKTARFEKKLQVDPYLEDATCSVCNLQQGPYFCRDSACFSYFCRTCFHYKHSDGQFRSHRPMMRTTHNKPQQQQQQGMGFNGNGNGSPRSYGNGLGNYYNNGNRHSQSGYYNGGGGASNHHGNGNYGFSNGGFGGNRQWGNGGNGRSSPQFGACGGNMGGGLGGPLTMNGGGGMSKFNGGHNSNGGHFSSAGGGANSNTSNGHGHQPLSHANRNFGQVDQHRQQQQQQQHQQFLRCWQQN